VLIRPVLVKYSIAGNSKKALSAKNTAELKSIFDRIKRSDLLLIKNLSMKRYADVKNTIERVDNIMFGSPANSISVNSAPNRIDKL